MDTGIRRVTVIFWIANLHTLHSLIQHNFHSSIARMNTILYWVTTGLVILAVGLGSFADIFKVEAVRQGILHVGFPEYMLPFLGVMKLLGTIAIVVPALRRFREAAYAGIIFYFIGATYCHLAVGDGIDKYGVTLFILALTIASYWYSLKLYGEYEGMTVKTA
jgi:hypothetical protein